jgi:hypothetical protein
MGGIEVLGFGFWVMGSWFFERYLREHPEPKTKNQ